MGEDKIYSPKDIQQMSKALMKDQINYFLITHRFNLVNGLSMILNFPTETACETAKYLLLNMGWNVDYKSTMSLIVKM